MPFHYPNISVIELALCLMAITWLFVSRQEVTSRHQTHYLCSRTSAMTGLNVAYAAKLNIAENTILGTSCFSSRYYLTLYYLSTVPKHKMN